MDAYTNPHFWLDKACTDLGLEDKHTIAIAGIVEIYDAGGAKAWDAAMVCRAIYFQAISAHHAIED